jgi:hypothetical protein
MNRNEVIHQLREERTNLAEQLRKVELALEAFKAGPGQRAPSRPKHTRVNDRDNAIKDIIGYFAQREKGHKAMAPEVATAIGRNKSTITHYMKDLVHDGRLECDTDKQSYRRFWLKEETMKIKPGEGEIK